MLASCISEALKENVGEMLYDMPTWIFLLHIDSLLKVTLLLVTHTMQDEENLTLVDKINSFFCSRYTNNYSTAKTSYISIFYHFNMH